MKLSEAMLRGVYWALVAAPPFNRWELPGASQILFQVVRTRDFYGETLVTPGARHFARLRISQGRVGSWDRLLSTMAHEMIHIYQAVAGRETRAQHNADFHRMAASVCKHNGFDEKDFI